VITLRLDKGSYTVEISGETPNEVLAQAELFSALPATCPLCGAAVHFTHRTPQKYEYFGLACDGSPAHESTFGERIEGSTLYYKGAQSWSIAPVRARDCQPEPEHVPQRAVRPTPPPARPATAAVHHQRPPQPAARTGYRTHPADRPA